MTDKLEQFQDKVSAMHENAERLLNMTTTSMNPEAKQTLAGLALAIKGQTVLAQMLLEVLKHPP